jgi:hypothetical protein
MLKKRLEEFLEEGTESWWKFTLSPTEQKSYEAICIEEHREEIFKTIPKVYEAFRTIFEPEYKWEDDAEESKNAKSDLKLRKKPKSTMAPLGAMKKTKGGKVKGGKMEDEMYQESSEPTAFVSYGEVMQYIESITKKRGKGDDGLYVPCRGGEIDTECLDCGKPSYCYCGKSDGRSMVACDGCCKHRRCGGNRSR